MFGEHTNGFKTGAGDLTLDIEVEYLNLSGIKILPSDSDRLGCCRVDGCPHCPLSPVCVQISPGHNMCDTLLGQQGLGWAVGWREVTNWQMINEACTSPVTTLGTLWTLGIMET